MAARRILVTGASGFLGRHCVTALASAGAQVVALSRNGGAFPDGVEVLGCDLLDPASRRHALGAARAECLVHFAWHADARDRWRTPANLDWISASLALAQEFAAAGGKRFVFVGSCAEYDWSQPLLSETDTPLRPATLYGAAKAATGMALAAAADALGIGFAWPRVFFCYGPGEPSGRLVLDLIAGLSRGERVACTDGEQYRDFMHASDIGRAISEIALGDGIGPINVATGAAVAVKQVIGEVARQIGRPELVDLGAIVRSPSDPPLLGADISRLQALGFVPRFDLASGIADTIAAFRADTEPSA